MGPARLPACRICGSWGSWRGARPEADRARETARTAGRICWSWADDDWGQPCARWALATGGTNPVVGKPGRGGAGVKRGGRGRGSGSGSDVVEAPPWPSDPDWTSADGDAVMSRRHPPSPPAVYSYCRACSLFHILLPCLQQRSGYSSCTPRVIPFVPGKRLPPSAAANSRFISSQISSTFINQVY